MVNIEGLNKAEVLAALYNNSRVQGMGWIQALDGEMTTDQAEKLLKEDTYFDYLYGKVMKVNLASDVEFNEWLYDRDNGTGKAERVINGLRK